ncbi:MAG: hypothetical protein QGD90_04505 [Candidatus Hydrogenedentes bacterium]|nr:hypothetical protein [Candidatus Hydrogenedentota bacterium]
MNAQSIPLLLISLTVAFIAPYVHAQSESEGLPDALALRGFAANERIADAHLSDEESKEKSGLNSLQLNRRLVIGQRSTASDAGLPEAADQAEAAEALSEAERIKKEVYSMRPVRVGLGGFGTRAPRFGRVTGPTFDEAVAAALSIESEGAGLMAMDWDQNPKDIEYGGEFSRTGTLFAVDGGVKFYMGEALVITDRLSRDMVTGEVLLEGGVAVTRGASSMTADRLLYRRSEFQMLDTPAPLVPHRSDFQLRHVLVPHGYEGERSSLARGTGVVIGEGIDWTEPQRVLKADSFEYDLGARSGNLEGASGHAGPLYFNAKILRILGPASIEGEDLWVTTCDLPVPHYRIRLKRASLQDGHAYAGKNARLQLGKAQTPIYLPRISGSIAPGGRRLSTELEVGSRAELGSFIDVAQWFEVTPNVQLAPRIYATTSEGTGFGFDGEYDFMDDPTSPLFRSRGSFHSLYTTEDNGYTEAYHRQELSERTVLLGQWEQWYEADFVKDFYNDVFEDRSGPRSFINLTHTRPQQIATATIAKSTHDFTTESEKLPEVSYHLLERRLGKGFYGTFDSTAGYYRAVPGDVESGRLTTVARLSYDWNLAKGINLLPFIETEGAWYSKTLDNDESAFRGSAVGGATLQTRFQRAYAGRRGFSGFKHIIVPSVTYSYRPGATLDQDQTPVFDDLDNRPGRSRIESSLDNILLGRNTETGITWPVARLSLYQGYDLSNEVAETKDYEVQMEVRPRPWWGFQTVGEIHEAEASANTPPEDLDRILSNLFFDNRFGKNTMNARVGFALVESDGNVFNREILYGFGYKLTENWSFAVEHRYDLERGELTRQAYELRRRLHKWEMAIRIRDRESGVDIGIEFNLTDFPGAKLGF